MEQCLFNTESNNCCAYCRYHSCSMTVKQMRAKECLQKECRHLVKNTDHQYWKQRDIVKQKRKNRKEAINAYIATIYGGMQA